MEHRKAPPRKKMSTGSIRTPLVKRDYHCPVSMAGWLYKLEGGAIKQWKKRWFVLAEFCLFYYKDMDEEKLLGTILLPSYSISLCATEDKISRKFAFKAGHQNMKTFFFSAENKDSQRQWMKVMSLASIMQKDHSILQGHSYGSPLDEEVPGFSPYHQRRAASHDHTVDMSNSFISEVNRRRNSEGTILDRVTENGYPNSDRKYPVSYVDSRFAHQSVRQARKQGQPLYANAPPKPHRTAGPLDTGYVNYQYQQQPSAYHYDTHHGYHIGHRHMRSSLEDRRSSTHSSSNGSVLPPPPPPPHAAPHSHRPSYDGSWHGMHYQDNYIYGSNYYQRHEERRQAPSPHRPPTPEEIRQYPPRPHSADFLERECYPYSQDYFMPEPGPRSAKLQPPPRPKSSLEQYSPCHYPQDDARVYMNTGIHLQPNGHLAHHNDWRTQNMIPVARHDHTFGPPPAYPDVTKSHPELYENTAYVVDRTDQGRFRSGSQVMQDSVSQRMRHASSNYGQQESIYGQQDSSYGQQDAVYGQEQKRFQQREESLKRLMEWKQRMLQSPLSRKYMAHKSPSGGQFERQSAAGSIVCRPPLPEEYKQKVLRDLENHENRFQQREAPSVQRPVGKAPVYEAQMQKAAHYDPHYAPQAIYPHSHVRAQAAHPPHPQQQQQQQPTPQQQHPAVKAVTSRSTKDLRRQSENLPPVVQPKEAMLVKVPGSPRTYRERSRSASSIHREPDKSSTQATQSKTKKSSASMGHLARRFSCEDEELGHPKEENSGDSDESSTLCSDGEDRDELEDIEDYQPNEQQTAVDPEYENLNTSHCDPEELSNDRDEYYKASQLFYSRKIFNNVTQENSDKVDVNEQLPEISKTLENGNNHLTSHSFPKSLNNGVGILSENTSKVNENEQLPKISDTLQNGNIHSRIHSFPQSPNYRDDISKGSETENLPIISEALKNGNGHLRSHSFPDSPNSIFLSSSLKSSKIEKEVSPNNHSLKVTSFESFGNPYDKLHFDRQFSLQDMARKEFLESQSTGLEAVNCSFEELRTIIQKKKEAPPPNIVSQRIKHFEETVTKSPDETVKLSPCAAVSIGELLKRSPSVDYNDKRQNLSTVSSLNGASVVRTD